MSGKITDEANESVVGAAVIATHTPSGTQYGTITNVDGQFSINGMRVGGPYTVEISYVGYDAFELTGIYLQLGETYPINLKLSENAETLNEILISAQKTKFATEKTGATTNINSEQIQMMPTINRSIEDISKLSPYSGGGLSFSGRDGRSTNFTVDGARLNNNFGLSDDLPGGGNPISLEAIEELQVVIAPFDVRQSNFIGGGINAITKSGTNTFKGSVYSYFNNQNFRGNKIGDFTPEGERPEEGKTIFGATLGGPIIKDKLFFFANFEKENSPEQITKWRGSTDGVANGDAFISHARQADLDKFSALLKERYGYDTGSSTDFPGGTSNLKYLGRLDWNISNLHKLSVRYNYTQNDVWVPTNGNSSDTGYRLNGTDRIGVQSMAFMNSTYSRGNIVKSIAGELNSLFSNKINNQFIVTYTDINDQRGTKSSPFPFIDIMNGDDVAAAGEDPTNNKNFAPYMSAGLELFTWNNGVTNKVLNITDNVTIYQGSHKFTAGVSYEHQSASNSYMRNGTGYYRFRSFSDFVNGEAPEAFALTYGYGGEASPAGKVTFGQLGLYVQDEWNIMNNFKLNYGLRVDNTFFLNKNLRNNAIYDLDFGGKKVDTGAWPDSKFQFSPRAGFNWDVNDNKTLVIRGGTGLFTGRIPLVFFTNMPQNSGMIQGASNQIYTKYNKDGTIAPSDNDSKLENAYIDGKLITDVQKMIEVFGLPNEIRPEDGRLQSNMAGVDPNFKMPQIWKTSLAFDYKVPVAFPLTITVEGIYSKYVNDIRLDNYNIKDLSASNGYTQLSGPDNRWVYPDEYNYYKNVGVLGVLTNTNQGYGYSGNITINAQPANNLDVLAGYTKTASYEVSGMPGSNASSAWQGLPTVDGPNFNGPQWSQYVTPDRLFAGVNYRVNYFGGHTSTDFGLFYQGYSPYRYSYTYSNDINGDRINQDLIYIPNSKDELKWDTPEDGDRFWDFVEKDKYLSSHKGQYADAYKAYAPMVHRFDLHVAQNFILKIGKSVNKLQVSADILNVGNMLNSTWGVNKQMLSAAKSGRILKVERFEENQPVFSFFQDKNVDEIYEYYNNVTSQTWQLQLGVRYIFN
ncbi:MAG: TonB-dependent receptor [Chitinophagales bacterium]|nr:TonB-dependent receptor [Chitinophagales bacterium]